MQEPRGHKLNRNSAETKSPSPTEFKQAVSKLMVLIESSHNSIDLVEGEIELAAEEICDRVSHFPKVFVDRFHQHLSESRSISDVELAVRRLNEDLEGANSIYRSIPKLPLLLIHWWKNHPQSNAIAVVSIVGFIVFVLAISGSFINPSSEGIQGEASQSRSQSSDRQ